MGKNLICLLVAAPLGAKYNTVEQMLPPTPHLK